MFLNVCHTGYCVEDTWFLYLYWLQLLFLCVAVYIMYAFGVYCKHVIVTGSSLVWYMK